MKSTIHEYRKNNFKIMSKKLLLMLLFLPVLNQAQVSPNVSKNYPVHIVFKIDDVVSVLKLDEETQIKIAKKFQKLDSISNLSLASGIPIEQLKANYTIDKTFLKNLVSIEDLERFAYEKDKDNRFLAALNSVPFTKLDAEQITKIRQLNDSLDTTPKISLKATIQFQNLKLSKILCHEQYPLLLGFIYKDQSLEEANSDWKNILKLKINTPGKENEEYRKIVDYHLNKNSFLDKKADRYDKKKRDFMSIKATMMEPPLLIRANILSDQRHANNKYASVIQYEKELNLSQNQIDSLLVKYIAFEKIKIENSENILKQNLEPAIPLPVEFDNVAKIITTDQINKWLILKNKNEAIIKSKESWTKLEKEGLTKELDKEKTIKELSAYHLKYLVAAERSKSWKSPETLFLLRDVEQKKPAVLQQLDNITRSKAKSAIAKKELSW